MNKKILIVFGVVVLLISIIACILLLKPNDNTDTPVQDNQESNNEITENEIIEENREPVYLTSIEQIPNPDSIIYYNNGVKKTFEKGSEEYNEIIRLNNKRQGDTEIKSLVILVSIDSLLAKGKALEYAYENCESSYFNLEAPWFLIGHDMNGIVGGVFGNLSSGEELINYLDSLQ